MEYESRASIVNGLSPAYPPIESSGRISDDYRDYVPRPMDPMDRMPLSPNQTIIKQEILPEGTPPEGGRDQQIRALSGIISAKEYEVTHFKDYNVHLQKVGSEREYEIDKLKKKLRDVENERDGMEKKWLDQVQSHVKEKYLIADLQKEVLLWKGKFKNLLDRVQGLECDARRDFDYSCRRGSMGDIQTNEYVHVSNAISVKELEQRAITRGLDSIQEKKHVPNDLPPTDPALHVPSTCAVSVIARDRSVIPRVYRPEPTYVYGYPSQAIHHASLVQNGLPPMKLITSGITYYDARREAVAMENDVERSHSEVAVVTDEASVHMNGDEEKEVEVDVDGKIEERIDEDEDVEEDLNKRLVIGSKAKIIVRKRSDPTRFLASQQKRKRVR